MSEQNKTLENIQICSLTFEEFTERAANTDLETMQVMLLGIYIEDLRLLDGDSVACERIIQNIHALPSMSRGEATEWLSQFVVTGG